MTPDLQALLTRLTTHLAPSTPDRMNYGFPIQLTQAEAKVLVDVLVALNPLPSPPKDPAK